jgi:hypothetical protein
MTRALIALLLLAGCPNRSAQVEVKRAVSPAAPRKGTRPRLAWVTWDRNMVVACNRLVDDDAKTVGQPGPCVRVVGPATPARRGEKYDSIPIEARTLPDNQPADQGPWTDCWLSIEDAQLVPTRKPARLIMHSPTGERDIGFWTPDGEGDAFHIEASFDPAGKQMAILRVAVGLGEGARTITIADALVVPVYKCDR